MAFSGTMVVSGRASGIVVATGSQTELGRINQMLAEVSPLETPLLRQIKKFGYVITAAIVGIAVSIIPEGPPALIIGACGLFLVVEIEKRIIRSVPSLRKTVTAQ